MMKGTVAAVLAMVPVASSAAVVVYDSYAAISAAGVVPARTFVAPSPFDYGDNNVFDVASPFAIGPVRFSGSTYLALYDDYATYIGGAGTLTIATPPVFAVGLYYGSYYGEVASVSVNGVAVVPALAVPPQRIGFIGFTSDTPITSIGFTGGETDIERGFLSAVPEPATWLQLVTGVGLVGLAVRRRERRAA